MQEIVIFLRNLRWYENVAWGSFRFFMVILMKLVVIFDHFKVFVILCDDIKTSHFRLIIWCKKYWYSGPFEAFCSNLWWYQNVAIGHFTIFCNFLKEIIIFWAFWRLFVLICNDVKTAYPLITAYPWMIQTAYPLSDPPDKQKYLISTSCY